jgi:hypothetical protein
MATLPLPDIQDIADLVRRIKEAPDLAQPAVAVVAELFRTDKQLAPALCLVELVRLVNALEGVAVDLPEGGTRDVGNHVVDAIKALLDPQTLGEEFRQYRKRHAVDLEFVSRSLPLFRDLSYDGGALAASNSEIYAAIDAMKSKLGSYDGLSDASKTVLSAQLDLLAKSVHRFQTSGVGPFRDAVFSIYGKIRLQLDNDSDTSKDVKREVADDILRIYGLLQIGGGLLKLGGPVVAGLLGAPNPSP